MEPPHPDSPADTARLDSPRPVPIPYPPALPGEHAATPKRRRPWLPWLIAALLLLLVAVVAWRILRPSASGGRGGKAGNPADAPQPVGTAKIATGDMEIVLTGLGTVTPMATITVQTQINGQLMSVGFQEGQLVRKGDFLAQIDPRPYQVTLEQAQGAYAHDTALLGQAKSDLARYVSLNRQDSIAKQQVTDQQFLVQQDQGLVMEDQSAIDSARLNLTYCRIVAPVSGRVGLRLVDPGNYIQTGSSTGLVVITQLQPISVVFVLPEDNIPAIAQEIAAGRTLGVGAYDRTNATAIAQGTLITVDNTVDTTTGTVKLRAGFANTDNALFPNQFVNARLLLKTIGGAIEAPAAAVQHGAPGSFVYLVKPDSTVGVQVVKIGITDGNNVQILSGVKPGDEVVVDGTDRLKDGAKIRVQADGSGTTPAAAPAPADNAAPAPAHKHRRHQSDGQ